MKIAFNYFPSYLAEGDAFCNRHNELKRMQYNLSVNNPILLISPRRYGKTSLALKAIYDSGLIYAHLDLYKALSEDEIEQCVLTAIGQLLGKLEALPQKLLQLASEFFSALQVNVVFKTTGIALDFSNRQLKTKSSLLLDALDKLETLAKQKKKRVVLFFDEFQTVGEVSHSHRIEAMIREVAQRSKHVVYIFAGSNRHLMEQMFFDKKKPFYKLCDHIQIGRIEAQHYQNHIRHIATLQKKTITEEMIDVILRTAECHPYYVNKICSLLWQTPTPWSVKTLEILWQSFVYESKSVVERELSLLSVNQRKVLIFLAQEAPIRALRSKEVVAHLSLSSSSISQSIQVLLDKDYAMQDAVGDFRLLDPLVRGVLRCTQK